MSIIKELRQLPSETEWVEFKGNNSKLEEIGEYISALANKKKLKDHPEKARDLWRAFDQTPFEKEIAAENVGAEDVLRLLNYPAYFDLIKMPLPENRVGILEALKSEEIIVDSNMKT